jgi:cytochrome c-type biogenesis protein CcmE
MRDGINFFRAPATWPPTRRRRSEVFRIGGLVEEGTLVRGEGETITFNVTDGGASIP